MKFARDEHIGGMATEMPIPVAPRRCPICGKRAATRHTPFCSIRCADIDLGRWLKGVYRVETEDQVGEADRDDE